MQLRVGESYWMPFSGDSDLMEIRILKRSSAREADRFHLRKYGKRLSDQFGYRLPVYQVTVEQGGYDGDELVQGGDINYIHSGEQLE